MFSCHHFLSSRSSFPSPPAQLPSIPHSSLLFFPPTGVVEQLCRPLQTRPPDVVVAKVVRPDGSGEVSCRLLLDHTQSYTPGGPHTELHTGTTHRATYWDHTHSYTPGRHLDEQGFTTIWLYYFSLCSIAFMVRMNHINIIFFTIIVLNKYYYNYIIH